MNILKLKLMMLLLIELAVILISAKEMLVPQGPPELTVTIAKVIKSCYGDSVKDIGIAGNFSNSFIASMREDDPLIVILLNTDERLMQNDVVSMMSRYKLQLFAVTAESSLELKKMLTLIKNSRWWNHMAQFYLFDSARDAIGCAVASRFLWTAWTMDILGAKFICNHGVEGTLIYTFNPYTQFAPAPWKIEKIQKGVKEHPWTLFVRKYNENANICETIDFDQTRNAGEYAVRLTTTDNLPNSRSTNEFATDPLPNNMLQMFSHYVNVTFEIVGHYRNVSLGYVDEEGKGHGLLEDLTGGRSDVVFAAVPLIAKMNLSGAYPILNGRLFATTQCTSYMPQWWIVISVIDRPSRISLCIVIVVNVIFLKYAFRQSFMIAILNTVRMICNSCFTKLPNNMGLRMYLACLFCFVVTVQALYQGQLAALLSKKIRYPNINNGRDLTESHHTIYALPEIHEVFGDPAFEGRFVGINSFLDNCTDYVLENSSIACVGLREDLLNNTVKSKLHMSKNSVSETLMFWPNREDWPLEDRLTRHNFYYAESGIFYHQGKVIFANTSRMLAAIENEEDGEHFKVLTLEDLGFAFVILGFGLVCATISFAVEMFFLRRGSRPLQVKRRVRFQRQPRFL